MAKKRNVRYTDADRRFARKWKISVGEAHAVRKRLKRKRTKRDSLYF